MVVLCMNGESCALPSEWSRVQSDVGADVNRKRILDGGAHSILASAIPVMLNESALASSSVLSPIIRRRLNRFG